MALHMLNYKKINQNKNDFHNKIIASFRINFNCKDDIYPTAFGTSDIDKISGVTTCFFNFGNNKPISTHIISSAQIHRRNNVEIEICDDEKQILLAWTNLIKKINPDIIIGYNILGFDFKYLKNRSIYLNIFEEFAKLNKTNNEISQYKERYILNCDLGDNRIHYFEMTGRIIIDIRKVIQNMYGHKIDIIDKHINSIDGFDRCISVNEIFNEIV